MTQIRTHEKHEAKKEACACGCDCGCNCGCNGKKFLAKSAVTLGCALIIAGAILSCKCGGNAGSFEAYIKENPKVIIDSVEAYYKAQEKGGAAEQEDDSPAEADVAKIVKEIVADRTNYSLGNPKGKFVIIEFFDHNCGWCRKTNAEMTEAIKTAKNIRWIPVDTPIFGEGSELIARYVLAAGKQGKYAQMHHAVGEMTGPRNEAALIETAKSIGLNTDRLQKDANSEELKNKLVKNREFTRRLKIGGVPMLIVNGKVHGGALLGDKLAEVVAESNK